VSSAGSCSRGALVLSRRFEQDVFALSIAAKDIEVALASRGLGAEMPMTVAASGVYQRRSRTAWARRTSTHGQSTRSSRGRDLAPLQKPPASSA